VEGDLMAVLADAGEQRRDIDDRHVGALGAVLKPPQLNEIARNATATSVAKLVR
jgi:hypothetical protein